MVWRNKITFLLSLFLLLHISPVSAHDNINPAIHMDKNGFTPAEITIKKGQKIVFENKDSKDRWPASNIHPTHEIYSEFDPKKPVPPGGSWTFVFDKPGIWRMHDHLLPQQTGRITVEEELQKNKVPKMNIYRKFYNYLKRIFYKDPQYNPKIRRDSKEIFTDDKALYSYLKKFGASVAIARLHELEVAGVGDCHQRAHKTGRISYELIQNEAFKEIKTFECHSGYFHGVMEAFFKENGATDLTHNLRMICGYDKNAFTAHQCFHGIGHGLMAWSDYELPETLKYCDLLPEGQGSCHSGAFMENVVGALALDETKKSNVDLKDKHVSKYLSPDLLYPCNSVEEKYQGTCYFFQTSRMMQIIGSDFAKIAESCGTVPEKYRYLCFMSMGRDSSGHHQQDIESTQKECALISNKEYRINCLTGAEEDLFWDPAGQDTAIRFCALLKDVKEKSECYKIIFTRAPQVILSKSDLEKFCLKSEDSFQKYCESFIKN